MGIDSYSTTAASNTSLFYEFQAPSTLNDGGRQFQADVRSWYQTSVWINWGHTPTRTGNTTFTVSTDQTAVYLVGRRIKCTDSSTIYGTIVSSSYSAPDTTVTIHSDSGNLSASLTAVAVGDDTPTNSAIHANLGRKGSDIASASTVDLSTATGDFVDVTGTTTITAFGTMAAGVNRVVRFTGALTLTYNATSLILPGVSNIKTANGDVAILRSLGSGNWQCVSYTNANGSKITSGFKGADIASATTTDLSTATGDFVDVTGTTTITGLGTLAAGREITVRFTGILTLTHNGTSLILPGAANITTASGDTAIFRSLGSGNWVCIIYQAGTLVKSGSTNQVAYYSANGIISGETQIISSNLPAGTLFNFQQAQLTTPVTTTSATPAVATGLSVTITPTSSSNKVLVRAVVQWGCAGANQAYLYLARSSTPIGVGTSVGSRTSCGGSVANAAANAALMFGSVVLEWQDTPATASATTYNVYFATSGGTLAINSSVTDTNSVNFPRTASTISAIEVKA
jgi:hypothetical protein